MIVKSRVAWEQLTARLRAGDTVIVYELDRIARSTKELLELIDEFEQICSP